MSIFGSREEDPLLQDDPFAPAADPSSSQSDRPANETPEEGETPEEAEAAGPAVSSSADNEGPAQDDEPPVAGGDEYPSLDGEHARRALVRGVDELERGPLPTLNTAFDQGWRLEKVVYRDETADLLFLLRRQSADQSGLIV